MTDDRELREIIRPWLRICGVLHAFDPNEENKVALAHALKFSLSARARLNLMAFAPADTARVQEDEPWATLARWSRSKQGAAKQPTPDLEVRHLQVTGEDPIRACLRYLQDNLTDLVVLSTHLQKGRMSWLGKSTAEALAAKTGQMTLFIPQGVTGFVSPDDGEVNLSRILVAVAAQPNPEPAIEAARRIMVSVPASAGVVNLVHVGDPADIPTLALPEVPGWSWNSLCKKGDIVETILTTAAETRAGLIVMTTAGHHGFLDAIRGTISEHVLREAGCPLLAMPVGSFLG